MSKPYTVFGTIDGEAIKPHVFADNADEAIIAAFGYSMREGDEPADIEKGLLEARKWWQIGHVGCSPCLFGVIEGHHEILLGDCKPSSK